MRRSLHCLLDSALYHAACDDITNIDAETQVNHVTLYRWVQRFTPLLIEVARPCRRMAGDCH